MQKKNKPYRINCDQRSQLLEPWYWFLFSFGLFISNSNSFLSTWVVRFNNKVCRDCQWDVYACISFSYKRITDFLPSLSSQFLNEKTIPHALHVIIPNSVVIMLCTDVNCENGFIHIFKINSEYRLRDKSNEKKHTFLQQCNVDKHTYNQWYRFQFDREKPIYTINMNNNKTTTTIILQMKQWTEPKSQFYQRCKCVYVQVLYNVDKYIYRKHSNCSIEKWWKRTSIAHSLPLLTTVVVVLHLFFWLILFSIAFSISTTRFSDKHFFSQRYP